jgi:hypothetical protein
MHKDFERNLKQEEPELFVATRGAKDASTSSHTPSTPRYQSPCKQQMRTRVGRQVVTRPRRVEARPSVILHLNLLEGVEGSMLCTVLDTLWNWWLQL